MDMLHMGTPPSLLPVWHELQEGQAGPGWPLAAFSTSDTVKIFPD